MAETIHNYIVKDAEDMKVTLRDWLIGEYCLSIGSFSNSVKIIGDLESLAEIFVKAETLVEIEGIRKRKEAVTGDCQEEKKRAEGR